MNSDEKSIAGGISVVSQGFLRRRFIRLFCLVTLTGLLFIGCSLSLKDNEDVGDQNVPDRARPETSTTNQHQSTKDVVSQSQLSLAYIGSTLVKAYSPPSSSALIQSLAQVGLWTPKLTTHVPPLIIDSFPADLATLDVNSKKQVFFHSLLPVVMIALEEVRFERHQLQSVLQKFDCDPAQLLFSLEDSSWQERLSSEEVELVQSLTRKYRHKNAAQLLERIDIIPVSLVMAQGAIESSWGTSRFAHLGNNLFGMWTWDGKGIVPLEREEGKSHKVAAYNSIIDSVRAYMLTINRLPAYTYLRELRTQTFDPIILTQGLLNYSERREAYVDDLQKIIRYNKLGNFDRLLLASL